MQPAPETAIADTAIATLPYDRALAEFQSVVSRLEAGGLPLEEVIALFERGVALHTHCAGRRTGGERRVPGRVEGAGGAQRPVDLRPDDEDA